MKRCITCGKTLTEPNANTHIQQDSQTYYVCCPLCEKEFHRKPEHYIAVAKLIYGSCDMNTSLNQSHDGESPNISYDTVRMFQKIRDDFGVIERTHQDISRHFTQISESGGITGLRNALRDHRKLMDALIDKLAIHAGVCRYAVAVAEFSMRDKSQHSSTMI